MATQLGSIKRVRRFPGFVVDGFNYQSPDVVAYFLTHFHADHTCGLHAGFKGPAPIYCTAVTAALLTNVMGVKPSLVCAVALNDTVQVQTADGANAFVTFLDANHCPGSATIHFRRRRGADDEDARTNTEKRKGVETREELEENDVVALHTGDFRAARCVREDPKLHALIRDHGPIGELYLDTTYCDPRWRFPDQKRACAAMAEIARAELRREPRTLFLVGSYSIGKERAVKAVANAVRSRVGVGWHRARTLKLTGWWDENLFLCEDDERAVAEAAEENRSRARAGGVEHEHASNTPTPPFRVRVFPMGGGPPHETMARALRESRDPETGAPYFKAAVSFRPTGWSYRSSKTKDDGDEKTRDETRRETRVDLDAVDRDDASDDEHERAGAASASSYAPWVENDGATRVYAVPYSEHSSFDELTAFVSRVKPVRITPTVNAQTDAEREKILRHFQHLTDASRDRNRLEHYFRSARSAEDVSEGVSKGKNEEDRDERLEGVDPETLAALRSMLTPAELRQQVALLEEAARAKAGKVKKETGYGGPGTGDPSETPFPLGCVALVRGGGGGFGGGGPKYAQFRDKAHVESRLRALGATVVHRASPKVTHVVVPAGGEALAEERRRQGQLEPPAGTGAGAPAGKPGFEAKPEPAEVKAELAPERDDEKKKNGEEDWSGARRVSRPGAYQTEVVTEGWVMRHWRAHQNGTARRHDPEAIRAHEAETRAARMTENEARRAAKRKAKEAIENGEDVRPGRERAMSRAVFDRIARAGTQRLFLVSRRDLARGDAFENRTAPSEDPGSESTHERASEGKKKSEWHARFAVFGATGNVYACDVRAVPSCDCPDFAGGRRGGPGTPGSRVCKHLLWLYMRVLGVPRDDPLLCQTALTQAELARLLAAPSAAQRATLAARAAREAYHRSSAAQLGVDCVDEPGSDEPLVPVARKNPREETCPVCFECFDDAETVAATATDPRRVASRVWWCVSGCGSNVHASCMRRWIAKATGDGFGGGATCPLCRAGWCDQEPGAGGADSMPAAATAAPRRAGLGAGDTSEEAVVSGAYVNLARFQAGTASGRDLEQYNDFARRAIEKRRREQGE